MAILSGAQITMEVLVKEGVEHIFGYPGGAIMPIYDAMLDYNIHHVLTRHVLIREFHFGKMSTF